MGQSSQNLNSWLERDSQTMLRMTQTSENHPGWKAEGVYKSILAVIYPSETKIFHL